MGKIFYSVDVGDQRYPVCWLDGQGRQRLSTYPDIAVPGQACEAFEKEHPGAQFVAMGTLQRKLAMCDLDREKIAGWNSWVKGGKS